MPAHIEAPGLWLKSCANCSLKGVCLAGGLDSGEVDRFSDLVRLKRRIVRGVSLFRGGDVLEALYVIHSGAFKTVSVSRSGRQKVTGFHLPGDILGLDAISTSRHDYNANALETSEVCVLPFERMQDVAHAIPALQRQLFRALSAEISRDQGLMLLLGGMSAEQRFAAFLLSLSMRYERLGFSPEHFVLRMSREDIGSYLGLTLETISRLVSRFGRESLIDVHHRYVHLTGMKRLREITGI